MANPIPLSVRKLTRRGAYSVHHQKSAPWKNCGANGIVGSNNPVVRVDPDGMADGKVVATAIGHGISGGTMLIAGGGVCAQTLVGCVVGGPVAMIGLAELTVSMNNFWSGLLDLPAKEYPSNRMLESDNPEVKSVGTIYDAWNDVETMKGMANKEIPFDNILIKLGEPENNKASPLIFHLPESQGSAPADHTSTLVPKEHK